MNKLVLFLLLNAFLLNAFGQKLKTPIDSVSYCLGIMIAESVKKEGFKTVNSKIFAAALDAVFQNKTKMIEPENASKYLEKYFFKLYQENMEVSKKAGEEFLAENKKKAGVITLPSGLQYTVLKEGAGAKPTESDTVVTHYVGTLIDGTVFDSSVERGQPAEFPVTGVIKGWTEILQLMPLGSKYKVFIPSELGYGATGAGEVIKPNSVLIFELELLEIK